MNLVQGPAQVQCAGVAEDAKASAAGHVVCCHRFRCVVQIDRFIAILHDSVQYCRDPLTFCKQIFVLLLRRTAAQPRLQLEPQEICKRHIVSDETNVRHPTRLMTKYLSVRFARGLLRCSFLWSVQRCNPFASNQRAKNSICSDLGRQIHEFEGPLCPNSVIWPISAPCATISPDGSTSSRIGSDFPPDQ